MRDWTQARKVSDLATKNTLEDLPPDLRPTLKPGQRQCLRCSRSFESWCKTRNRICVGCNVTNSSAIGEGI